MAEPDVKVTFEGTSSPEVASRLLPEDGANPNDSAARQLPSAGHVRIRRPSVNFKEALQKEAVKKKKPRRGSTPAALPRGGPPTPEFHDQASPQIHDRDVGRDSIEEATEHLAQTLSGIEMDSAANSKTLSVFRGFDSIASSRAPEAAEHPHRTFSLSDGAVTARSDDEFSPASSQLHTRSSPTHGNGVLSIIADLDVTEANLLALAWLCAAHKKGSIELVAVCVNTVGGDVEKSKDTVKAFMCAVGLPSIDVSIGKQFKPHLHAGLHSSLESFMQIYKSAQKWLDVENTPEEENPISCQDEYHRMIHRLPGQARIICFGPVCNVMAMEQGHTDLLAQVQEIVCVGGAFEVPGDITAAAERNVGLRPEDFHNFLKDYSNPIIVPRDVESQYVVQNDMLAISNNDVALDKDSEDTPHPVALFLDDLHGLLAKKQSVAHHPGGAQVHALGAAAYFLCPQHLSMRRAPVRVETLGRLCRGKTLFDVGPPDGIAPNAWVVNGGEGAKVVAEYARDLQYLV